MIEEFRVAIFSFETGQWNQLTFLFHEMLYIYMASSTRGKQQNLHPLKELLPLTLVRVQMIRNDAV